MQVGEKALEICLKDQDGKEWCLKDAKGKWVILYFYPKDNTPGCTIEAVEMSAYQKEWEKRNAIVVGVSADSCQSHKKFEQKHQLKLTLLSDTEKKTLQDYGVWQLKKVCGRETMGIVRTTYIIDPEGKIAHIFPEVQAKGHAKQVLETLDQLIAKG